MTSYAQSFAELLTSEDAAIRRNIPVCTRIIYGMADDTDFHYMLIATLRTQSWLSDGRPDVRASNWRNRLVLEQARSPHDCE